MAINQQICLFDFLPQFLVILLREGGCITQNVVHVFCHLCSQCIEGGPPKKKAALTRKSVVYVVVTCKRSAGHGGPGIRLDACNHLLILSKIYIKGLRDII